MSDNEMANRLRNRIRRDIEEIKLNLTQSAVRENTLNDIELLAKSALKIGEAQEILTKLDKSHHEYVLFGD